MLRDRREAGERLARRLADLAGPDLLVAALPRGGVPVAYEIARALKAPLDVVVARKLKAPNQPELALGAVCDGDRPESVLNPAILESLGVSEGYLRRETARELKEIGRQEALFRAGAPALPVAGRRVILVDDGVATGASARAAVRRLKYLGAKSILLAVPVASSDSLAGLRGEVSGVVCLEEPEVFVSVGAHYEDFEQVEDAEVARLLQEARRG